jgi:hypothetical protein
MNGLLTAVVVAAVLALIGLALSVRIVQQYEKGVLFRTRRACCSGWAGWSGCGSPACG